MTDKNSFTVLNCKGSCQDPTWCNFQQCCIIAEEADIDRLEDERQSEAYYQQITEDQKD
jgi:hypothetical protein